MAEMYYPKAEKFIRHVENLQESDKKKLKKQTNGQTESTVTSRVKENLLHLPGRRCGGGTCYGIK